MAGQMTPEQASELLARLTAYVAPGARSTSAADAEYLTECVGEAWELVGHEIGAAVGVPDEIRDRAVIECGSELFNRRQAPSGITQYADATGAPVRLARDPMTGARAILAPYLPLRFA